MEAAEAVGFGLAFATLTISHDRESPLDLVLNAVKSAWARARRGGPYEKLRSKHGLFGAVNVVEVSLGPHGWHAHVHAILVSRSKAGMRVCAPALATRYERFLTADGFQVTKETAHVQDVHAPQGLAEYLAENWLRVSDEDRRCATPFDLLKAAEAGDLGAAAKLFEWHRAARGLQQGRVSRQLADKIRCARSKGQGWRRFSHNREPN